MVRAGAEKKIVNEHFQANALFWKEIYEASSLYGKIHQFRLAAVLNLVDKLDLLVGSFVLVVGCGAGHSAVALARRGHRVEAVDAAPAMIDLTRRSAASAGLQDRITASIGDIDQMAFPDNTFDLVLTIGVTPWLSSLTTAVQEVARVLKPKGYLVISMENRWSASQILDPWHNPVLAPARDGMRKLIWRCGLRAQPLNKIRAHRYSIGQFDTHLEATGLKKIEGRTFGFGPFRFFGHRLFSEAFGTTLHEKLQELADHNIPPIRSAGNQYLALMKKHDRIAA